MYLTLHCTAHAVEGFLYFSLRDLIQGNNLPLRPQPGLPDKPETKMLTIQCLMMKQAGQINSPP